MILIFVTDVSISALILSFSIFTLIVTLFGQTQPLHICYTTPEFTNVLLIILAHNFYTDRPSGIKM